MKVLTKTVKITNRRNVLVQIPGFIIAEWPGADELEVYYDKQQQQVTIKPNIRPRGNSNEEGAELVSAAVS